MKKISKKELLKKFTKIFEIIGAKINLNTWYFTILFFICILVISVIVWWQCFQNPLPSNKVLLKIEQEKVNYGEMKTSTEQVITTLQESREKFENPPFFGNQRELFLEVDVENIDENSLILPKKDNELVPADQPAEPTEDIIP